MKGLLDSQIVTVIDEDTIVWGVSVYKKQADVIDLTTFEKELNELRKTKKSFR